MSKSQKHVTNDPVKGFKEIWRQHPEWQNQFSSSWWFFLFLPKQGNGYGPKQMMFAFASRRGELISFAKEPWGKGIDPDRELGPVEKFNTTISGWIHDGQKVHDNVLMVTTEAELDYDEQSLEAWKETDSGKHGARIEADSNPKGEYGIKGKFVGGKGGAEFRIWNSGDHFLQNPQIVKIAPKGGRFGGVQYIPWRRFAFEGEFTTEKGTEKLEGLGYFQRVLMNIPMLPWTWIYIIFQDGSIFSSFMINFGPHLFNRKLNHMNQFSERFKYHVKPRSFFFDPETQQTIHWEHSWVIPKLRDDDLVDFFIKVRMDDGDYLEMKVSSHGHSQFTLDSRKLGKAWEAKYIYNEYMVELDNIKGKITGKPINDLGKGWGNIEYTHGMGL